MNDGRSIVPAIAGDGKGEVTTNVRELRPADTFALFYSIDAEPRFAVMLCAEETLHAAVHSVFFGEKLPRTAVQGGLAASQISESAAITDELRTKGEFWLGECRLELAKGIAGVVKIMAALVAEAREATRYEDGERVKALNLAKHFEGLYCDLRRTLRDALGDAVPEIAAKVAGGAR